MKDLFKYILASFLALVLFTLFILVFLSALTRDLPPEVPDQAVLAFDLSLLISDKPASPDPAEMVEQALQGGSTERIDLYTVLKTLHHAASDDRIAAIYLHGESVSTDIAILKEVREGLQAFQAAGKKIFAYNVMFGEKDYYLASLADSLRMHPGGVFTMNGLGAEMQFYGDAFEKYGVGIQVTRVGKYKSAVEPFLLNKMSPANREQLQLLLDDIYAVFIEAVSASRSIPLETLAQVTNEKGFLTGQQAVEGGFMDGTAYFDEVLADLKNLAGAGGSESALAQITLQEYAEAAAALEGEAAHDDRIAVIYAEGEIVDGDSEQEVGGDTVARLLRQARLDPIVKAVVLRVDSPGGSASASEVILREVELVGKQKPMVVSMGSLAASGGYWISTLADEILAQPSTITGSIGVYGMFPNIEGVLNRFGVNVEHVETAPLAHMESILQPKSNLELQVFQDLVDQIYVDFLDRVCRGRSLEQAVVEPIAQGRVWSGTAALELGLVDGLGGLEEAIRRAAGRAGLEENAYSLTFYQEKSSFMEEFVNGLSGGQDQDELVRALTLRKGGAGLVGQSLRHLEQDLKTLDALNDPRGLYARLPFNIRIH